MKESVLWPILQQARNHATSQSDILGTNFDVDKFERKFAELIVRECANVCRDDGRWFQEQDDKVEAGVAYALCYKIKQHFRVEQ